VKGILYDHCPTALKTENIQITLTLPLTLPPSQLLTFCIVPMDWPTLCAPNLKLRYFSILDSLLFFVFVFVFVFFCFRCYKLVQVEGIKTGINNMSISVNNMSLCIGMRWNGARGWDKKFHQPTLTPPPCPPSIFPQPPPFPKINLPITFTSGRHATPKPLSEGALHTTTRKGE
jgi:hypothetical protein